MGIASKQNSGVELNVKIAYAVIGMEVVVDAFNAKMSEEEVIDAFKTSYDEEDIEVLVFDSNVFLDKEDVEEIYYTSDPGNTDSE